MGASMGVIWHPCDKKIPLFSAVDCGKQNTLFASVLVK